LVLEICKRKILLAGWRNQTANRVIVSMDKCILLKIENF